MSTWSCCLVKPASPSRAVVWRYQQVPTNRNQCVVGRSPEAAVREPHRQRCPYLSLEVVGFATRAAVLPGELLSALDGIQPVAGQ
jgi:hypothetical protein